MISPNKIKLFKKNGYVKIRHPNIKVIKNLKKEFAEQIRVALKRKIPSYFNNLRKLKNDDDFILNQGMLKLEKQNHENLVEIYNSLPRSIAFYQVISDDNLIKIVNQLLGNTNKKKFIYKQ